MSIWGRIRVPSLVALAVAQGSFAQVATWNDAANDAVPRRTDVGNDGTLVSTTLPDLLSASLQAWNPANAKVDPYTGTNVPPAGANFFRLDLVVKGLATPPGPLGFSGLSYEPKEYGDRPLYGFIELDLDNNPNSGGEIGGPATQRYLANIARFARVPTGGGWVGRVAKSACDYLDGFFSGAQYERSGADWTLSFCGCVPLDIEDETPVNPPFPDGKMGPGETIIVQGRLFTRAGGFEKASGCFGSSGGPIGLYEPDVEVRFAHDIASDTTTITLVWALDMVGAARLKEDPPKPGDIENPDADYGNQASVYEGLWEVANYPGNVSDPATITLTQPWWSLKNQPQSAYPLNPLNWRATAILGTTYAFPQSDGAVYAWTDTGFVEVPGDLTGDGLVNASDDAYIQSVIQQLDGKNLCPPDADASVNGQVVLGGFSQQFHLADTNYDGLIGEAAPVCYPDCDASGSLDIDDFICFQTFYALQDLWADCDQSGSLDIDDFICFQTYFAIGC